MEGSFSPGIRALEDILGNFRSFQARMEKEEGPALSGLTVTLQPAGEGPQGRTWHGTGGVGPGPSSEAGSRRSQSASPGVGAFPFGGACPRDGRFLWMDGRMTGSELSSSHLNSSSDPSEPEGRSHKHGTPHLRAAPSQIKSGFATQTFKAITATQAETHGLEGAEEINGL